MRKTALSHDILMQIEKPARYLGNEINSVHKTLTPDMVRFAMCFPDVYEIGMSHLGIQILYDMFNRREDVWCERVYSPWTDLDRIMREKHIPLFALESQDPVKGFDFLGITLQYEMCYTNVLQILDLSGIPYLAENRSWEDPLVIGGGPCSYNPEPLAPFFDMFYIGEGEVSYDRLLDVYKTSRAAGETREEFLHRAAQIPGIYVPSLYHVEYNADGTICTIKPYYTDIPEKVRKAAVMDLNAVPYPEHPVVPFMKITQDRVVLEVMRGCIRGCRFCQAGMIYRPLRERSPEFLLKAAEKALASTGADEVCLSSLSSSDYRCLPEVLNDLITSCREKKINISLPSLRIDAFSLDVMNKVQDIRKSSLTFACEAGTQRLRDVINKGLTEEEILDGAAQAFRGGWNKVKLYFMLGLPTETEEDMLGIPELAEKIAKVYYAEVPKEQRQGRVSINASASFFVPKPFTPFQWASMLPMKEYLRRAYLVKDSLRTQLNHKSLSFQYHDADVTVLEGILARGDRRVAPAILKAYEAGCLFDAWNEYFRFDLWLNAFADCGLDVDFYTTRVRQEDEIFPWDFIDIGVTRKFLLREWNRSKEAVVTPNCREHCSGCGAGSFGGGICHEDQA